jgi:hypothetical protein
MKKMFIGMSFLLGMGLITSPVLAEGGLSLTDGLSVGSRYQFDTDDGTQNRMRLFVTKEFLQNHSLRAAWDRQVGRSPNFLTKRTSEGIDYGENAGQVFFEYVYKF